MQPQTQLDLPLRPVTQPPIIIDWERLLVHPLRGLPPAEEWERLLLRVVGDTTESFVRLQGFDDLPSGVALPIRLPGDNDVANRHREASGEAVALAWCAGNLDGVLGVLLAEQAADVSDAELERCLGRCVGSHYLLAIARANRDLVRDLLRRPMADELAHLANESLLEASSGHRHGDDWRPCAAASADWLAGRLSQAEDRAEVRLALRVLETGGSHA